jgi:hypothetical protein
MTSKPEMKLVRRKDLPSILVDEISGLEFTVLVRDVPRQYVDFECSAFQRSLCTCRARRIGLIRTPEGPIYRYTGSLRATRANFEDRIRYFTPEQRAKIGSFEDCLPRMIKAWQIMQESPSLLREGGRVEVELRDVH